MYGILLSYEDILRLIHEEKRPVSSIVKDFGVNDWTVDIYTDAIWPGVFRRQFAAGHVKCFPGQLGRVGGLMFDLHCHILPGVDDGADCWDDSLEMARIAVRDGVKTLVATPHYSFDLEPASVVELVSQLNQRLAKEQIALTVAPGMEAYLDPDLPSLLRAGRILTIGANYLLVELPFNSLPIYTDEVLFQVMLSGYKLILAHPERNNKVIHNPGLIYDWVTRGMLVQVNSGSILGKFGSQVKQTAEALVRANLVHFIGSDAHSPNRRRPDLGEACQVLSRLTGEAEKICNNNGHLLLEGRFKPQENFTPPVFYGESWWKRLWGK